MCLLHSRPINSSAVHPRIEHAYRLTSVIRPSRSTAQQDDIGRVQVALRTVALVTQRFLRFGQQYRCVALGIDDRIDLTGQQCRNRGFSFREPLREVRDS